MSKPESKAYLFEVRDSDGNDCNVFDAIVEAPDRETASQRLWKYLEECYPNDESDGGYGTFHECDCVCEHNCSPWDDDAPGHENGRCGDGDWECSHGGLVTNEDAGPGYGPEEFPTVKAARAARQNYHSQIELLDEEN